MTRIQFLLLSFLLLLTSFVTAQSNYPIYVTPTLTPPYSLKLSDYGAVGSQHLMVQINVNDLNIVDLPVKLHIKLETAGVTIETPPTITTTPIYLNGGVTSILFGEDLADYFHINNLIFKGYSKDAYKRTGQLPGGFYKFTVEVLHYNTNRLISNSGNTSAWIVLGKPPVLQLPEQGEEMGQYPGMPLSFSWLASNVGSPVSVGTIQYTFELWEMRVEGVDPNTVVQSIPVFHEETTFNTFCQIYPATLMMEPGMRYAWRITAKDASGYVPFEQDGHSQVRTFVYKAKCEDVSQLKAEARGRSATFTWDVEPNHTSFNVEIRQPATGWMLNSETYDSKAAFFDLDQGQVYEMRVQAVCNADPSSVSDYSEWTSVKIPVQQPLIDTLNCPTCGCDDNLPQVNLTNFELRSDLAPGDTIINKTGTTRFILHKVEPQGENTYTGIFYYWAEIWGIKFVCEYDNLQVNTDNVIVNMNFESVYDPQFLLDVDALTDYLGELADNLATVTTGMAVKDTLKVDEPFDVIYVNDTGQVVAVKVDADGKVDEKVIGHSSDLDKTLVTNKEGKEYVISGNGQAMGVEEFKATGGNSRLLKKHNEEKETNNLSQGGMVGFRASEKQHYGFDSYSDLKKNLQAHYLPLSNGYRPAWKSLPAFGTDPVEADTYDKVVFKDEMGLPAIATAAGLSLRGSFDGAEVPLYAYRDTTTIVGKLNMVSYAPKTLKLYLVPVNTTTLPDIFPLQDTINDIYKQAVVSWQVTPVKKPVEVTFPGGQMTHGGSGSFSTYNADQKAIINAFTAQGNVIDKNAFYLFFIDNVTDKGSSIAGFMPLQRQFGFIYGRPNYNTIAHELAHGAFNLYHTFSAHDNVAPEGATPNLMDYTPGARQLWKHQWDLIHNPENLVLGFMQDEEEGEAIRDDKDKLLSLMNTLGNNVFVFLKKCDRQQREGELSFIFSGIKYKAVVGKYDYITGDIEINEGQLTTNEIQAQYNELDVPQGLEEFILIGRDNKAIICHTNEDYSSFCSNSNNHESSNFIAKWMSDIANCVHDNSFYQHEYKLTSSDTESFESIKSELDNQLSISYFSNVKIVIRLIDSNGNSTKLYSKGISSDNEAEIAVDFFIDYANKKVYLNEQISDDFIDASKLSSKIKATATQRNLSLSELQQESSIAFELLREERINYGSGFIASIKNLLASYTTGLQVTGKIGKNVWEVGEIPDGLWYSKGEGRQYYQGKFTIPGVPSGAVDGIIGEVAGLPLMIKTTGEIALDAEKRQAFTQVFSKDGMQMMLDGIVEDFKDEEKRPYAISKTTVEVASMFVPGGAIVKIGEKAGKELAEEALTAFINQLPGGPQIAKGLSKLKFEELVKVVKELGDRVDFDKIAKQIGEFSEMTRLRFAKDLLNDVTFFEEVIGNPDIIKLFQIHKFDLSASELGDLYEIFKTMTTETAEKWKNYGDEMQAVLKKFKLADDFEKLVSKHLRTVFKAEDGFSVTSQVYLKVDGVTSIADDIIYNSKTNQFILNETKYGVSNILSKNQKIIEDAVKAGKKLEIRTVEDFIVNGKVIFSQGDKITISRMLRSHSVEGIITNNTIKTIW
ncbi:hypothetical protein [Carboxylicivirga taeanensis]|uniref:hypothetical protein n=1 Tax=Carboxylicivirga taeanensis TaxID=1416875 RepID=UPI003F6DACBE